MKGTTIRVSSETKKKLVRYRRDVLGYETITWDEVVRVLLRRAEE